jgi:hypothetical protein
MLAIDTNADNPLSAQAELSKLLCTPVSLSIVASRRLAIRQTKRVKRCLPAKSGAATLPNPGITS